VAVEVGIKNTPFVTPLFQEYELAPTPVRMNDAPAQIDVSIPADTVGVGLTFIVI
jgi:hypothetical protein